MSGGFDDLGLMPEILTAIEELGWSYVHHHIVVYHLRG